jgi:hypothetical protein
MKIFKLGLVTLALLFLGLYPNASAQQQASIVFANNSNETTLAGTLTRTISTALHDFNGDMNTVYQSFVNDYANAFNHQAIQGLIQVHQGNVRMPSSNNAISNPMSIREAILRKLIQSVAAAIIQISQANNNIKQFFTDQQHCLTLMQQIQQRTPQPFVQAVAYNNNFWTTWATNIHGVLSAQNRGQYNQFVTALLQNGYEPGLARMLTQHETSLKRIWQFLFAAGVAVVQFGPDVLRCVWNHNLCDGAGNFNQELALYTTITGTGIALWELISFLRKRKVN